MLENFDPNTIADEAVRQIVLYLMNRVENLEAKVQEQAEEIQRLGDENNRLKGEQGKPKIKANQSASQGSSEKERRESDWFALIFGLPCSPLSRLFSSPRR